MTRRLTAPIRERQTYRNLAYLALALPLGLVEFVFLVFGLALGLGLLITWIGLAVLLATLAGAVVLARVESVLAERLLGAELLSAPPKKPAAGSVFGRLTAHLACRTTWTSLAYLAAKLPLGVATFVLGVAALGVATALAVTPLAYPFGQAGELAGWEVDTLAEALAAGVAGVTALPLVLHLLNGVAALWSRFSRAMLPAAA
jgi:hypothetical protein